MSTFIRKYNNEYKFLFSSPFHDKNGNIILAAGKTTDGTPLIVKTDASGNCLWERKYEIEGNGIENGIEDIIKIGDDLYLAYMQKDSLYHVLMLFNSDGELITTNGVKNIRYKHNSDPAKIFIKPFAEGGGFYMIESPVDFNAFFEPRISMFDSSAEFIDGFTINEPLIINSVDTTPEGIALACVNHDSFGHLLFFDRFRINSGKSNLMYVIPHKGGIIPEIDSVKINDYSTAKISLLLSGRMPLFDNKLFVSTINLNLDSNNGISAGCLFTISDSENDFSSLSDNYYLCEFNKEKQRGIVHKLNPVENPDLNYPVLNILWSKTYSPNFDTDGIVHSVGVDFNRVVFNLYDENVLGCTNSELNSDFTVAAYPNSFSDTHYFYPETSSYCTIDYSCTLSFIDGDSLEIIEEESIVQSPYIMLMAAGSDGSDGSTPGIHLRWMFNGELGKKHLPKGNLANSSHNFNKPDDFVKIKRMVYTPVKKQLDLTAAVPSVVDNLNCYWTYNVDDKTIKLGFHNKGKYAKVLSEHNPLTNTSVFLEKYGNELVEVSSEGKIFFRTVIHTSVTGTNASMQVETISETDVKVIGNRVITNRMQYELSNTANVIEMTCENGCGIRYKAKNASITELEFEFYEDAINHADENNLWIDDMTEYALSLNDTEVFSRLEPQNGDVHETWPRFINGAHVNIQNYKDRWSKNAGENDRNIKELVSAFIHLSNASNNPLGLEQYLGMGEISLLDLLNMGAIDYHVARMLGLGKLDTDIDFSGNESYIYLIEYDSHGNMYDGKGVRTIHHRSLSLPTSIRDKRLPLPVSIKEIVPGIVSDETDIDNSQSYNLFESDGYTPDGRYRFVSLMATDEREYDNSSRTFFEGESFEAHKETFPVFAGVLYKKDSETEWQKPDIHNDPENKYTGADGNSYSETIPLFVSENKRIIYVHKQSGGITPVNHHYCSYGINIFSRSNISNEIKSIETQMPPKNGLKPPSGVSAFLIRKEEPVVFTSQEEQTLMDSISGDDKTLIRMTFDYSSRQELYSYNVDADYNEYTDEEIKAFYPDEEIFADEAEIYFRNKIPVQVSGKIDSVKEDAENPLLLEIATKPYTIDSTKETLIPNISSDIAPNFRGGLLVINDDYYVITNIKPSPANPVITVYKKALSVVMLNGEISGDPIDIDNLPDPLIGKTGLLFSVTENMQGLASWGSHNPHSLKIPIGTGEWQLKTEVFTEIIDGENMKYIEKSRGFWEDATVEHLGEGIYKIIFNAFNLTTPQFFINNSMDWHKGQVRLLTNSGGRKEYNVIAMERNNPLVLYFEDNDYSPESSSGYIIPVKTGNNISVNYYPGYKIYLYANDAHKLNEKAILPALNEGVRYSIFGLRSRNTPNDFYSDLCVPAVMYAQEIREPKQPEPPTGADYTTRPDFFGKASYSFTVKFQQTPESILFYRSNEEAYLNALYTKNTIDDIRSELESLGGYDEDYAADRWRNFLDFEQLKNDGEYQMFPEENGYAFPLPDKEKVNEFIDDYNKEHKTNHSHLGSITMDKMVIPTESFKVIDFIKKVIQRTFVPLTELPVVYRYIRNDAGYSPLPKKQHIRDRNGKLLSPSDPEFDMAPMAKIVKSDISAPEVFFTDYSIDATSRNYFFYSVREMNSQMQMGQYSDVIGPVKTVNTTPPPAPEIKRVMPVLGDEILGIVPSISFEINASPRKDQIGKLALYRALDANEAMSIRSMTKVMEIDLEEEDMLDDTVWRFNDEFTDMNEVPYGDPVYYRVTVSRVVPFAPYGEEGIVTPSQPSKILATLIVDTTTPEAPVLSYTSNQIDNNGNLNNVSINWEKTVYNGRYRLYKMNAQGNWENLGEGVSNNGLLFSFPVGSLSKVNEDGNPVYHHFKVVTENSSGIFSTMEEILTI